MYIFTAWSDLLAFVVRWVFYSLYIAVHCNVHSSFVVVPANDIRICYLTRYILLSRRNKFLHMCLTKYITKETESVCHNDTHESFTYIIGISFM